MSFSFLCSLIWLRIESQKTYFLDAWSFSKIFQWEDILKKKWKQLLSLQKVGNDGVFVMQQASSLLLITHFSDEELRLSRKMSLCWWYFGFGVISGSFQGLLLLRYLLQEVMVFRELSCPGLNWGQPHIRQKIYTIFSFHSYLVLSLSLLVRMPRDNAVSQWCLWSWVSGPHTLHDICSIAWTTCLSFSSYFCTHVSTIYRVMSIGINLEAR